MNDFAHMVLNDKGLTEQKEIQKAFEDCMAMLKQVVDTSANPREYALARTHMQQACFWMKKCSSLHPINQKKETK